MNRMKLLPAAITLALCAGYVSTAGAHGYVTSPESRSYQFYAKVWPANEIEAPKLPAGSVMAGEDAYQNSFEFPPDGRLASGNSAKREIDNEQYPWRVTPMKAGVQDFKWHLLALHRTTYFTYYITKPDWKSKPGYGQQLTKEMFEEKPFCHKIYPYSPNPALDASFPEAYTTHSCNVPQRTGEQKIYAVWRVRDTHNAFYQMLDVKFDGDEPPVEEIIEAPTVTLNPTAVNVVGTGNVGFGYRVAGTSNQDNVNWKWEFVSGDNRIYARDYQNNGSSAEILVPKDLYDVSAKYRLIATNDQNKSGEAIVTLNVAKPAVSITGGNTMPATNPLQLQAKANFNKESYTWRLLKGSQLISGGISQQGLMASGLPAGDYIAEVSAYSDWGLRSAISTHAVKVTAGAENHDKAFIAALKLTMQSTDNGGSVTFSGGAASDTVATSTPAYHWSLPSGAQDGSQSAAAQRFTLNKTSQAQNLQVKVQVTAGSESRELVQSITVPALTVPGGADAYNPRIAYPVKCTEVSHEGQTWQSQWYVNAGQEEPGTGGAWGAWRVKSASGNTCS